MDLFFTSPALHEACSRQQAMRERWGEESGPAIAQLLQELDAVERLGDLESLPHLRLVAKKHGALVTVRGLEGVGIRVRPQTIGTSGKGSDPWQDCTEALVLDVIVAPDD